MVKFIATDLDGTLLDEKGRLPKNTFDTIEKLYSKGVLFAPASGRQYANLRKLFQPVADKILFICENGALVKYKEETLFSSPVPQNEIKYALDKIRRAEWAYPMLCGVDYAYIEDDDEPFFTYSFASYSHCRKVENLDSVIGKEDVCKIAIFDKYGKADFHAKELHKGVPKLRTIVSGKCWCDMASHEVNKGVAIEIIRKKFSFSKEDCMAFGDHMNDYEMLMECGQAYVAENGYPPLKEMIKRTVANADGVIRLIGRLL